ncbi:MAG: hypothetical protein VX601_05335, partial [Pseudomonadota bacterium]|nr:hypothetical protein [Pseudomonadota bacterium]
FLLLSHVSLPDDVFGASLRLACAPCQHSHPAPSAILGKICSQAVVPSANGEKRFRAGLLQ